MALSLVNNVASLNAQNSLTKTNSNLSTSLERLSTGLKVNRGADGPAALVISEKMRAQMSGLQTALDNTNKAVSMVQVGEGALNEVNSLLNKARSLALDSANAGVNDAGSLDANNAELTNILGSINDIANRTTFNGKKLLDGSADSTSAVVGAADLVFQTGANSGETATLKISSIKTADLFTAGAPNIGSTGNATTAITSIDGAIKTVTNLRGTMGAFQANNLESNANTLSNTLQNTTAAESTIRDTDFASEIANFTKLQTQMQAGSTVLGNANQMTSMIAQLLRG